MRSELPRKNSTWMKGYSFSKASFSGRTTCSTISVVYKESFAFFLRAFDENLLPVSAIHQGDIFDRSPRRTAVTNRAPSAEQKQK